jgi:hypothetical protein
MALHSEMERALEEGRYLFVTQDMADYVGAALVAVRMVESAVDDEDPAP